MAVKYYCPKCARRFVDWGAEKLEFKCPSNTCDGEELILPGSEPADQEEPRSAAKRPKKRKAAVTAGSVDIVIPDLEDEFTDDVDLDAEDDVDEEGEDDVATVISGEKAPPGEKVIVNDDDDGDDDVDDADETFSEALGLEDADDDVAL